MYIMVIGGGEIGYYLAKMLLSDSHEVLILEKDASRCAVIAEELGSVVVRGDGCEAAILDDVGTARADLLIAVTGDDEDNLVACQVAKHKFNVPRTIARIKNPRNETIFKKLGIDVTVSSTNLILAHIEHELPIYHLIPLIKLKGGGVELEVVEVKIPPNSAAVGKRLADLHLPRGRSAVLLVTGKEKAPQAATGRTILEAEDEVVAVTTPDTEELLRAALTGT